MGLKPIPITAAKYIADTYGYDQIIILGRKVGGGGGEHLTTYGKTKRHCEVIAKAGEFLKREVLKWSKS